MQRDQSAAVIQKEEVITEPLSPLTKQECGISHIFPSLTRAVQNRQVTIILGSESRQPGGHPSPHRGALLQAIRKAWLSQLRLE